MTTSLPVDFVFRGIEALDSTDLLTRMGQALAEQGYAKADYPQGLLDREAVFPTGLPVEHGVALPHTDGSFVLRDTLAVATLAHPVTFREMGGLPQDTVEVRVVILIALADGKQHLPVLTKTVNAIQRPEFVAAILDAATDDAIRSIVSSALAE
jgi:PTS system galactitol-specific IIA component